MGELASRQIPQATKITFYVILVVIIPMIGILGPELAVRILFPKINYVGERSSLLQSGKFGDSFGYRANATGYSWGVSLTTDEFGFRHDPQQKPQPKTVPSIVILGDSAPNGIGVEASVTFSTCSQTGCRSGSSTLVL